MGWTPVASPEVGLPKATVVYEDDLPLSDIVVADDRAVCCARRVPELAEVIVWPRGIEGSPVSWTGQPSLRILRIFAFTGSEVYAQTEHELLRVRPGVVETLHTTRGRIYGAWLSPDAQHVLWVERARGSHGYVARVECPVRPSRLRLGEQCCDARWLSSDEILVLELHHVGDEEAGQSVHVCDRSGTIAATPMRTDAFALSCGPTDPASAAAFFFGHVVRETDGHGRRPTGAWLFAARRATWDCVANAAPAGGTAVAVHGGCLFADAWRQTAESSRLVFASRSGSRAAVLTGFLRDFAIADGGRTVLFRSLGTTLGIASLSVQGLVQDSKADQASRTTGRLLR